MNDLSPKTYRLLCCIWFAFAVGVVLFVLGAWAKTNGLGPWDTTLF